ncbi:MAG: nuclear transport factor 2 family protein [Gammaproteobacteria bacterium]|nr:nuclear transport factor 2 family protein [Gammaproteobacteria bacterium]MCH9745028.1 nuclear transport factor 2 family protein [Gammaproteobacteria bacterium]
MASNHIQDLKNMFNKMVVEKNISLMSKYYDPTFKLYSNGETMNYQEYYQGHKKIYKTPIQYSFKFDKNTLVQEGNKVAARLFITTKEPRQAATKIEVILIAQYRGDRIYRLWELTYPNWSKLKAFKSFSR